MRSFAAISRSMGGFAVEVVGDDRLRFERWKANLK